MQPKVGVSQVGVSCHKWMWVSLKCVLHQSVYVPMLSFLWVT